LNLTWGAASLGTVNLRHAPQVARRSVDILMARSRPGKGNRPNWANLTQTSNSHARASPQVLANSLLTATRIGSDDTASFALPPSGAAASADLDGRLGLYS